MGEQKVFRLSWKNYICWQSSSLSVGGVGGGTGRGLRAEQMSATTCFLTPVRVLVTPRIRRWKIHDPGGFLSGIKTPLSLAERTRPTLALARDSSGFDSSCLHPVHLIKGLKVCTIELWSDWSVPGSRLEAPDPPLTCIESYKGFNSSFEESKTEQVAQAWLGYFN